VCIVIITAGAGILSYFNSKYAQKQKQAEIHSQPSETDTDSAP